MLYIYTEENEDVEEPTILNGAAMNARYQYLGPEGVLGGLGGMGKYPSMPG